MGVKEHGVCYFLSITFLAFGLALIHMYHVSTLFENDRHFSHLSNLEREMTFRTEMGFYYHYYKVIVEAPTFEQGLEALIRDNQTEYPDVINALQRFNLYPEVVIGGIFRLFDAVTKKYQIPTQQCWEVSRGPTLPPVNSCEGFGDPMYFYLEFVWYSAGLAKAVLFLYAVLLSDSLSGGLLTILSFLYNHGHCTRVQWAPPLRESFGYPFCLLQLLTVTYCLKKPFIDKTFSKILITFQMWAITFTTLLALILWQFSQFVIATQAVALLVMYCTGIISRNTLLIIVFSQLMGLLQASVLLFGNEMLFQSILFSLLLATIIIVLSCEQRIEFFSVKGILVATAVTGVTFTFKTKINQLYGDHDAHIFELLLAKLTNFKSFHTLLYTCSPEFDFLPMSTVDELTKTCLLPTVAAVICMILFRWARNFIHWKRKCMERDKVVEPDVAYNILQLAAFTIMAVFIMRLKLFWTPHLCLMASLIMSRKYLPSRKNLRYSLLALLIAAMSYHGVSNIIKQRKIIGEYVNLPFEEVLNWINGETLKTDVFAGPMSVMANVLLSTDRRIVNHPHYEHQRIRDRTLKVYSIFSRQSPEEVYTTLLSMGVDYVILEESWCFARSKENCSMVNLWDITDLENRRREPICPRLFSGNPAPFVKAFSNEVFVILSLKARQFLEITPIQQYQI